MKLSLIFFLKFTQSFNLFEASNFLQTCKNVINSTFFLIENKRIQEVPFSEPPDAYLYAWNNPLN